MFVTDPADTEALLDVHGELFADIRPAATLVTVAGLMHPSLLVEIEAEARRG
jgi:enamine deaminase RidA (YjgF/YER057c/UK114 family)